MGVEISMASRIRQLADQSPDETGLRHIGLDGSESSFTWSWLHRRSSRLAGALAERGLGHGDRLGLGLRNLPQFTLATFAAWKLGAVPVPVRWDVPEWELARLREVIEPRVYLGPADLPWIDGTAAREVPDLPDAISPEVNGICSSGSTGTPKVILSRRPSLYTPGMGAAFAEMWMPIPKPQEILVLAPMYHANGFTTHFNQLDGDRLTVMEKFDAARVVDVIERYRISTFTATPTMLQRIADLPGIDDRDLSSIEWVLQGAAPMPPSLVHRWAKLVGAERIVMAYGMTEGLGLTTLRGDEWMTHEGSVGRGFRGTEVRILDPDGAGVPVGEIGEIYLRTPAQTGYRYLGKAPRLRTTADGFATAGDMGRLDADGYLYLADRRVDMIISGGANVFPAEVEAALIDHPAIADVVVVGLRDAEWGRRVHAIVEASGPLTVEEVRRYAKDRLAPYKVPKTVEFVDEIPRSAATKVNRGALVAARGG
ncbi:long-chain fatty acid--CoA ligase [Amycolatopsis sp. K13G38]|uniref:Long-chain fatty acid--CoA ligase n=1 Tax=Amycolatopsis acididurans TaxID=2724524 RepID=A0ABX1J2Y0_9PSEU|nr:AMP-binding protein [Amycolatopsis acididurans]NKQ53989.1 long-chain fatty acid--CoA ligase [Amycolatopsis acididurans]